MLPAVAATSPTLHACPSFPHLRLHEQCHSFRLLRHRPLAASARASSGAGRARLLLSGAFASGDGGAGQEASPSTQAKICSLLEHLAASEQHATAMTAACTGSVIEAILEIGVIHGTRDDPENLDDHPSVDIEELSQAVSAAVRLLTKLLNFDLFIRSITSEKFTSLLRRILKSSFPLQSKNWLAACLFKLESRAGVSVDHGVSTIDMEIILYETIPRLVEQMMTSFSFEKRRSAVIELNKIISGGVMEYTSGGHSWRHISTGENSWRGRW